MANQWFRLYSEFCTDPKVQMMSESLQRRFIMIMCLRCSNGDVTLHDDEIAFCLRVTEQDWIETKREFMQRGFIDEDNKILNWDKRQFVSDSSAARVSRHRAKKKIEEKNDVTLSNVTETAPDTDTDTDTDTDDNPNGLSITVDSANTSPNAYSVEFESAWSEYPKRSGSNPKRKAFQSWTARRKLGEDAMTIISGIIRYRRWCESTGKIATEMVMQASRFLGPDRFYLEDWQLPARAPPKHVANRSAETNWNTVNYDSRL